MSAAPAKFLFNVDFGAGESQQAESITKAALEIAVAEAETRGYRGGHAAGQAEASA